MKIINKENSSISWYFQEKKIQINFEYYGHAIYSERYKIIVVMSNYPERSVFNVKAYSLNGDFISEVSRKRNEDLIYNYISENPSVNSGVVIIASYEKIVENFYDWQFEIDLDKFEITNRIAPSY
ncbi:hypothetical protein [Hafnia alvei]|uniref:hypothetical protein n=1 Tax=Hafnia alvei TaxID=569 RepID=UPI001412C937|nr:hypothetical protein [Hafnia alvei]QIP55964.1 hypothetical protein HBA19_10260 [Hafnia alvei]